jgi:hypothetical protein
MTFHSSEQAAYKAGLSFHLKRHDALHAILYTVQTLMRYLIIHSLYDTLHTSP